MYLQFLTLLSFTSVFRRLGVVFWGCVRLSYIFCGFGGGYSKGRPLSLLLN